MGFPGSSAGKESTCQAGDTSLIPGSGRSTGEGIDYPFQCPWAFLVAQMVKNPPAMWATGFYPWIGKIPWRKEWLPTPVSAWSDFPPSFLKVSQVSPRRNKGAVSPPGFLSICFYLILSNSLGQEVSFRTVVLGLQGDQTSPS